MYILPNIHQDIITRLKGFSSTGIILQGKAGVGKKVLAGRLANSITTKDNIYVFDKCLISDVRRIEEIASSFSGKPKVFILNADNTTTPAFNALLKVIEEGESARFIFHTSTGIIPVTIISRCLRIRVPRLTQQEIMSILVREGLSRPIAKSAAECSEGSMLEVRRFLDDEDVRTQVENSVKFLALDNLETFVKSTSDWKSLHIEYLHDFLYLLAANSLEKIRGLRTPFCLADCVGKFSDGCLRKAILVCKSRARVSTKLLAVGVFLTDGRL